MGEQVRRFREVLRQNARDGSLGIFSVCSSHPLVIRAAIRLAQACRQLSLIETTCHQVNQYGGYSGLKPAQFADRVYQEAERANLNVDMIVLGGDHLGPNPWKDKSASEAMQEAEELVALFARAGFKKLHLDCSMSCADDPDTLPVEEVADRAARLALAAEHACTGDLPIYVIGTEVPPPGGMGNDTQCHPTPPGNVSQTYDAHQRSFHAAGLASAFERVVAMVVQPGVEFGNRQIIPFVPEQSVDLVAALAAYPGMVFEAHSTDYQSADALRSLVESRFGILKVGPAATAAAREAIYLLEDIESALVPASERSNVRAVVRRVMLENQKYWNGHYDKSAEDFDVLLNYSFSDRIRYYWDFPDVARSVNTLINNIRSIEIHPQLLSQYGIFDQEELPMTPVYLDPEQVVVNRITRRLQTYSDACGEHF